MAEETPEHSPDQAECLAFIDGLRAVVLATVDESGEPDASQAPFVRDQRGRIYLYLSELAKHTPNLRTSGRASLLWLADEAVTQNPFARQRLTLQCAASVVARGSAEWERVITLFTERFGPTIGVLRQLADFHLFRMRVRSGSYVKGFAQAFELHGEALHVGPRIQGPSQSTGTGFRREE